MKRTIPVTMLLVGMVGLSAFALVRYWPAAPRDSRTTAVDAPPTRLVCYGYVDSRHGLLLLRPARAGRVTRVFVKEKQTVCKDAPLLQIDDRQIQLREQEAAAAVEAARLQLAKAEDGVKQYQAKQAQAEAALEAANANVRAAEDSVARTERLVQKELVSQSDLDIRHAKLDAARALARVGQSRLRELKAVDPELDVLLARRQVERSQAALQLVQHERDEHLLRAPMNGLVLRVQAQEGDLLSPTAPQSAVWMAPADGWIVRAEVMQEFAGHVEVGLEVRVEDEADASVLAMGRISEVSDWFLPRRRLSELPTAVNSGLALECVIDLQEPQAHLRFGQRVRVRILKEAPPDSRKDAPSAPSPPDNNDGAQPVIDRPVNDLPPRPDRQARVTTG